VNQATSSDGLSYNGSTEHAVRAWMERAESIDKRLKGITGDSPSEYLSRICLDFLADYDKDPIHEQIIKLGKLQKAIYKYQNEIFSLDGVGPAFRRVDNIVKHVCMVVGWVEELLCYAMVDADEVKIRYEKQEFLYQIK
jgi:hypothetical protein